MSGRAKAWLIGGYVGWVGVGFLIARWQHWDSLTTGPRPWIVVVCAVPYWGAIALVAAIREIRAERSADVEPSTPAGRGAPQHRAEDERGSAVAQVSEHPEGL